MPEPFDPYIPTAEKPWNRARVQHLYRRLGFGADLAKTEAGLAMQPGELVDQLIDDAAAPGPPDPPDWAEWTEEDYDAQEENLRYTHFIELVGRWLADMVNEGIRAKMALFWHNHFVTEKDVYTCNAYMWSYYSLIHEYAFGNFRTFVEKMGVNPAMLVYLDGNRNTVNRPNENYARELMELFTMGESNGYTQADIPEVARALTGWTAVRGDCTPPEFVESRYDDGEKTIFGMTGSWDYDGVHELIFTHRQSEVSRFIAEKLFRHFVYTEPVQSVTDAMAEAFRDNDWELAPMLKVLFKSEYFFEGNIINAQIKDPLSSLLSLVVQSGWTYPEDITENRWRSIYRFAEYLGQELFNPVDVAGWPGQRAWINENTLSYRWSYVGDILFYYFNADSKEKLRQLAIDLSDNSADAEYVTRQVVEFFLGAPLEERYLDAALQYFKGEIPENYFDEGIWDLQYPEVPDQMVNLMYYIARLPEFQLT